LLAGIGISIFVTGFFAAILLIISLGTGRVFNFIGWMENRFNPSRIFLATCF
jgi:hypothetical protein